MGFWSRTEDWLLALQADRTRLLRYLRVGYWISLGFALVGFAVIVLVLVGAWTP